MVLRNIVYTIWAMNKGSYDDSSPSSCYVGYTIKRIENKGYIILAFFGPGFSIALQDMQLIMDVCPLRVDSLFVRDFQPKDDLGIPASSAAAKNISAAMCISVLDINQPVQITESEVVRVKKRSRGVLFPSLFGKKA
jgi:hypothetical protein